MEDASKPNPPSKVSSPSSAIGNVRCCQEPGRSVKRTETNFAPWSEAYFKTVLGFMISPESKRECWGCSSPRGSNWCEAIVETAAGRSERHTATRIKKVAL